MNNLTARLDSNNTELVLDWYDENTHRYDSHRLSLLPLINFIVETINDNMGERLTADQFEALTGIKI